jgi:hypothetical protein
MEVVHRPGNRRVTAGFAIDEFRNLMLFSAKAFETSINFSEICDNCIETIVGNRVDEASNALQTFGRCMKQGNNKERDNMKVSMIILLCCSLLTDNSFTNQEITFNAEAFAEVKTARIVIDALWCLSISFLYAKDIASSIFDIGEFSLSLIENVDICIDSGIAKSLITLFANFASSNEGRNMLIRSLGVETIFSIVSTCETKCQQEIQHLLHNMFRFKIITGEEESEEEEKAVLTQMFSFLLQLTSKKCILNCLSIAACNIQNFREFVSHVPDIVTFARANAKLDKSKECIDICSSCIRLLGQINEIDIDTAHLILSQILEFISDGSPFSYNEVASAVCWAVSVSEFDVTKAFKIGFVDQLFALTDNFQYQCKKYSIICLSIIACECGNPEGEQNEYGQYLIDSGIIQLIAPFARSTEKPKTQELVLSAIVSLASEDDAYDFLGDPIDDLAESEDEKVSLVAQLFIKRLNE